MTPFTVTFTSLAVVGQLNPSSARKVELPRPVPKTLASAPGEIRVAKLAAFATPLMLMVEARE